ncbi:ABC transporter permease [Pseudonocardiaceae bacterium YIM PH 21723]|nr:ABC transporter permease [Pseudonocardiaceae bacterium YIM PH 21723]
MTVFTSLSIAAIKGFVRDRVGLFFTFFFPLMFLIIFGLLFTDNGPKQTKLGVVGDGPVITALRKAEALNVTTVDSVDAAVDQVRKGDLPAVLTERDGAVELRFAASDRVRAGTVQGIVGNVVNQLNLAGQPVRFHLAQQPVEDTSLKPIQFVTPGILSWSLASSGVFGAALTIVSWRRKQVLRRMRLAPVNPLTVLSSRLLVSVGIGVVQAIIFIGLALTPPFGLKLAGQWWLAAPLLVTGLLAFFAIGMLAASFTKTEEATAAVANLIVLPMAFLSGTFFPLDNAPRWLEIVSKCLPLRYLNDGMTAVLSRGQGVEAIVTPMLVLLGFTVVVSAIAAKLFTWEDS